MYIIPALVFIMLNKCLIPKTVARGKSREVKYRHYMSDKRQRYIRRIACCERT